MEKVSDIFEESFLIRDLKTQIANCDKYELVPLFGRCLPENQPILEAGCGSGRWVAWFNNHGWKAVGLDWSQACCERARNYIPEARFEVGDMRAMPFADGEFGAIVSLGAIEHSPEGPERSLMEYSRVLRENGIAIITVPFLGQVRRFSRFIRAPQTILVRNRLLRRLLKKRGWNGQSIAQARRDTRRGYAADFILTNDGWEFFQYSFTKRQMKQILHECGFQIVEEFVEFGDEGILHYFGRMAGFYDYEKGRVAFTIMGRFLRAVVPLDFVGHMLCYLVRKPSADLTAEAKMKVLLSDGIPAYLCDGGKQVPAEIGC